MRRTPKAIKVEDHLPRSERVQHGDDAARRYPFLLDWGQARAVSTAAVLDGLDSESRDRVIRIVSESKADPASASAIIERLAGLGAVGRERAWLAFKSDDERDRHGILGHLAGIVPDIDQRVPGLKEASRLLRREARRYAGDVFNEELGAHADRLDMLLQKIREAHRARMAALADILADRQRGSSAATEKPSDDKLRQ